MGIGQSIRNIADRARGKVKPEQAERGVEQAGDKFDQATGGKYADKVDQAQEKANEAAQKHLREEK
ncbi:MAG TPA: antitoxin [Natronosporangium sp.]|nr:antitoxin [Natronosporangium sp.]